MTEPTRTWPAGRAAWRYEPSNYTLVLEEGGHSIYEVDLEQCDTSAEMLDWIFQVARKAWATARVVGALVTALDDLLDPQGRLCSGGRERGPIAVAQILAGEAGARRST